MPDDIVLLNDKVKELEERIKKLESVSAVPSDDILLAKAIDAAKRFKTISASLFQRRFSIGYTRAAKLIDELEEKGIIESAEGTNLKRVLINKKNK